MIIAQISDCHLFADTHKLGYNSINPFQSLKRVLQQVTLKNPSILLVTGDISADGSGKSYQHFVRLIEELKISCELLIIPGNHDDQEQIKVHCSAAKIWCNSPHFILPNNWHIHLINTQYQDAIGRVSKHSLDALSLKLSQYYNGYHLLAAHHHPLPCGGWMDKHEWQNREEFNALVKYHSSVKAVVYGHIHMEIEQKVNGALYMGCPSSCWQFANRDVFSTTDLMPGFRMINLAGNGQISTSVYRLE